MYRVENPTAARMRIMSADRTDYATKSSVVAIDYASAVCTDSLLYRWSVQLTLHTFLGRVLANKHGPSALNTPLKCSMVT